MGFNPGTGLVNNTLLSSNAGGYWQVGAVNTNNNGTIEARNSASQLDLTGSSLMSNGTLRAVDGGFLNVRNGTTGTFTNTGTIIVGGGSQLAFGSGITQQTAGTTTANGTLSVNAGNGTFSLNGGTLLGNGTMQGNLVNSGGIVTPGASAGKLTLSGNYTQGAMGTLLVEIGGTIQGTGYDFFQIGGSATLAGTLQIGSFNGFPVIGSAPYRIMTFASRTGTFDTVVSNDAGVFYNVIYGAGFVDVVATPELDSRLLMFYGLITLFGIGRLRQKPSLNVLFRRSARC